MGRKPLILITNDDGIDSPGLLAIAEAVEDLGEILIAAPASQQTSMGRAFPRTERLGIIRPRELQVNGKTVEGYEVNASPAGAVAHGIYELADRRPSICLSGINYGENLGTNLTCSGTVGAILEANTHQVPGIAFSMPADIQIQRSKELPQQDWKAAKKVVHYWTERLLYEKLIYGTQWLNINMPDRVPEPEQYIFTRQSNQNYFVSVQPPKRDLSQRYELGTTISYCEQELDERDDIYAVRVKKTTSVTPIVHNLTVPELR